MDYSGIVVVITGGASGIGKSLVEAYCEEGAIVAFLDHDYVKGSELEFQLRARKQKCTFLHVDVSKSNKLQEAIRLIYKMFHHINILINNAAMMQFKNFYEITVEEFTDVIQTNLIASFVSAQMFAKLRKQHNHQDLLGRIINLSSTRAFMSEPNTEAYGASKGGINALTHNLAMTLSSLNIQVNAIAPGWICHHDYKSLTVDDHHQHPSNRVGKPTDIVQLCQYLTDSRNDFINGQTIVIDGGMTKKMIYAESI